MTPGPSRSTARIEGFTLIELMVVIAILAILLRSVFANLGAIVPSSTLDAESQRLMAVIDYLRSEAELQGKVYKLELDLDQNRYREVWPPELKVATDQDQKELVEQRQAWIGLDDRVKLGGFAIVGDQTMRKGRVTIVFDRNGNTADQVMFLRMKSESLENMVWSVQIRGLERGCTLVRDETNRESYLQRIEEAHF